MSKKTDPFVSWEELTQPSQPQRPRSRGTDKPRQNRIQTRTSPNPSTSQRRSASQRTDSHQARQSPNQSPFVTQVMPRDVNPYVETELRRRRKRQRRKRKHPVLITAMCLLLAVIIGGGVAIWGWYSNVTGRLNDSNVVSSDLKSELKQVNLTTEPSYMLLLGTDGRPGETSYRSDTIMLARIDPVEKKVTLVSIPRDTMVTINGQRQKINAAHAIGGAEGAVKAASSLCGVDISHYAEVSFDGMEQLVDAVGGVDIDVEDRVYDPEHFGTNMVIEKGQQHLNGEYAMFYARSRNYPDGDYTRTRHQRNLVKTLATQVLQSTDATTIVPLVNSMADMVTTDLSPTDIIALANTMRDMSTDDIYTCTIPSTTEEVDGQSYVVADVKGLKELMDKVDVGEDPQGPSTMGELLTSTEEEIQAESNASTNTGSSMTNTNSSSKTR